MADDEYTYIVCMADNGVYWTMSGFIHTHWFQGSYLVIEGTDDLMIFTPSTRSIDDSHERVWCK